MPHSRLAAVPEHCHRLRSQAVGLEGKKWSMVAKHVEGRSDVQCRERYVNVLDPDLNPGEWTAGQCSDVSQECNADCCPCQQALLLLVSLEQAIVSSGAANCLLLSWPLSI